MSSCRTSKTRRHRKQVRDLPTQSAAAVLGLELRMAGFEPKECFLPFPLPKNLNHCEITACKCSVKSHTGKIAAASPSAVSFDSKTVSPGSVSQCVHEQVLWLIDPSHAFNLSPCVFGFPVHPLLLLSVLCRQSWPGPHPSAGLVLEFLTLHFCLCPGLVQFQCLPPSLEC